MSEISAGPPAAGIEIAVTGPDYDTIAAVTGQLASSVAGIDGVVNMESRVAQARPEVAIEVDPEKAGPLGLTTQQVGRQLSQYLIGQQVTTLNVDGESLDVVLSGNPTAGVEQLRSLLIFGATGPVRLSAVAEPVLRQGPVSISRTDGQRSASITADIVSDDAQAVGVQVDEAIAALDLPPGVTVTSGGVFADIAEGFQAIFISMAVGLVLVYLVMVAGAWQLEEPLRHHPDAATGRGRRDGRAGHHRPRIGPGGHEWDSCCS